MKNLQVWREIQRIKHFQETEQTSAYQCRSCHLCAGESLVCTHSNKIQEYSHICAGSPHCEPGTHQHLQKRREKEKKSEKWAWHYLKAELFILCWATPDLRNECKRNKIVISIMFNQPSYLRNFKDKHAIRKKCILFVNQHKPSFLLLNLQQSQFPDGGTSPSHQGRDWLSQLLQRFPRGIPSRTMNLLIS